MLRITSAQLEALSAVLPNQPVIAGCSESRTWISIELRDDDDQPVAGARYRLRLPDFTETESVLDDAGRARVDGIMAGTCQVSFPDIDAREWFPV